MKVAVRLDDITPDMDWERFLKFKALLDRRHIQPLIGVVPKNQDQNLVKVSSKAQDAGKAGRPSDFWSYVKGLEKEGWVVAMHGCCHVYSTGKGGMFPLNNFSEFAGLPYGKQKELLERGRQILKEKGISTEIFMAPAHSYDGNTLKALRDTGFRAVTDGFGDCPYRWKGLDFYPISFRLGGTFKKAGGYSTMVVHTNTVTEEDLKRYQGYFENRDVSWISFGEYLKQPVKKRGLAGRGKEFLMAKGKSLIVNR